jgi:hypothetical protein
VRFPFQIVIPLIALVAAAGVPAVSAAQAAGGQSAVTASTTLRIRGIVQKYDTSTRTLSLKTRDGIRQVQLAPAIPIRHGWEDIEATELAKLAGYRAAVRYSDAGGQKIAESVHVFGKDERGNR